MPKTLRMRPWTCRGSGAGSDSTVQDATKQQDATKNVRAARWVLIELQGSEIKRKTIYMSLQNVWSNYLQLTEAPISHVHAHVLQICMLTTSLYAHD